MGSDRNIVIAFGFVALAIIVGAVVLLSSRPEPVQIVVNPPAATATPLPTETPAPLVIYVTGEVVNALTPVIVPPGSRVSDALEAAGGVTDAADMARVNIAAALRDGDQVHVPSVAEASAGEDIALPTASGGDIVNVNFATLEELDTLPGVGPSLAEEIILYRETNGPFAGLDDLDLVPGIGPALLDDLAERVRFE